MRSERLEKNRRAGLPGIQYCDFMHPLSTRSERVEKRISRKE